MKLNRKELIAHYSKTKPISVSQRVGERAMVLFNAECTLHPGKWRSFEELVTFALEQSFGEEVE